MKKREKKIVKFLINRDCLSFSTGAAGSSAVSDGHKQIVKLVSHETSHSLVGVSCVLFNLAFTCKIERKHPINLPELNKHPTPTVGQSRNISFTAWIKLCTFQRFSV